MTTTTTTLADVVNAEFISPLIGDYASDYTVAAPYMRWQDLRGKGSKVGSFPRAVLDTATDIANETTDIAANDYATTQVSVTAAEIGIRRDVTDAAVEDTVIGRELFDFLTRDAGILFAISLDEDICAGLFPGLSTSVGTSGSDLTLSNMVQAQASLRKNKARGQLVYVLDDQQAEDYQVAIATTQGTMISQFVEPAVGVDSGYLGTFMGAPVYQTGLCATANANADVVGACFIRGDTSPRTAAFGAVLSRDIRVEMERNASARITEVVGTARWGVGEIFDAGGVKIVTDL
jgi:hypothetical protein